MRSLFSAPASGRISYPWPFCPSAAEPTPRWAWFPACVWSVENPSAGARSSSSCRSSTESLLVIQIGEVGRILSPSSKTAIILTPFLTKCLPLFPGSLHRIAAIPRTEDLPQILGQLSLVAVAHATQQIAFQVRRISLQRGSRKDRTDDNLQALQPVSTHQADLPM